MCDCSEIQELRNDVPRIHDFIHDIHHYDMWIKDLGWQKSSIWLPRQDQIQEMFKGHVKPQYLTITLLTFMQEQQKFYKGGRVKKLYPVDSMEQIWLAFYMYEKHQKIWDGKKWKP